MSDKNIIDNIESEEDRRKFLKISAKIAAVMATVGYAGQQASAATSDEEVAKVLKKAMVSKNIESALSGSTLDQETADALRNLTPRELEQMADLDQQLSGFIKIKTRGGTGIIIY